MQTKSHTDGTVHKDCVDVIGHDGLQPKYKQFTQLSSRLGSFRGCTFCGDVQEVANAGFYHTGNSDIVQCFFCGLKLRNWDSADSPWVEHARHGKNCAYLNRVKGKDFTKIISQKKEILETDGEHDMYSDDLIFTTAATALLQMGCYTTQQIREAMKIYVHRHKRVEFTAHDIASVILKEIKK